MKCGTKKMAAGGGIREGKARFGDDVRERAKKKIAEQMAKAENKSKFGGKEPSATPKSKPVAKKPAPAAKPKPTAMPAAKPNPLRETVSETARRAPRPEPKVEQKSSQFGPATTFPRDVGAGKAAQARKESMEKQGPFGDLMDLFRGKKTGGGVKKMAKGGSVAKRADGVAKRGKTKGRMI